MNVVEEQSDCRRRGTRAGTVGHVEAMACSGKLDVADDRAGDVAQTFDEALRLTAGMAADRAQQLTQLARLAFDRAFITVLIAAALLMALGAGVVKLALRK